MDDGGRGQRFLREAAQPAVVTATTKGNRATWWLWGDLRAVTGMD